MKKILFTTVLILTVVFTSVGNPIIAEGQSNTSFGNYTITALDEHVTINGREMEKYLISYEKPDMKVIVAVDKQKNARSTSCCRVSFQSSMNATEHFLASKS